MGTIKTGYENRKSECSVMDVSSSNVPYKFSGMKRNILPNSCIQTGPKRFDFHFHKGIRRKQRDRLGLGLQLSRSTENLHKLKPGLATVVGQTKPNPNDVQASVTVLAGRY
ncbi:hypothetical protein ACFX2G_035722 [Malus domestica]